MTAQPYLVTRLSIMMFLQFFVWGAFFVTMGSYLLEVFQDEQGINSIIGQAYATHNWAALLAPVFVGLLADRVINAERLNALCQILGGVLLWYASSVTEPGIFIAVMFVYFMLYMPTLALVNTIAFSNIEDRDKQFPAIRVWGTVGWIVAGFVVAQTILGWVNIPLLNMLTGVTNAQATSVPLQMAAVLSVLYGLYSLTLPATPPQARGQQFNLGKAFGLDALNLLKERNFLVFALCSFLISIPLAFYYARTNDFVAAMAFGEQSASFMAIGQISEVLFMLLVPFFLIRFGVKWMLIVAMGAWALRYFVFASFPESVAMLIFGIALHGICYDFFFVTGQLYVDRKAPVSIRASAQGLFALLTYGAGMLVGNYMLGWWGDSIALDGSSMAGWQDGAFGFWIMPAVLAVIILIFFAMTFKREQAHATVDQPA
ncbi:MFS transporter [Pseudohongiella spirulinae]|uniref:Major facilitator transporter n=1 Tax=Pseudohongiella spirulinae TaxID=1249552 RepID=A0A0S2KEY4_9GAMM|nr:MFS transporter [Pseudohongiella spirulinae]ALO46881.1 major facilitator transporter [Pseudohongiella spirulinae]